MYRIFDNKEKQWIKEGVFISPNNSLSTSKKALFGTERLSQISEEDKERYIYHRDIGIYDKNKTLIFEGDICCISTLDNTTVIGIIAYAPEHASYYLFDNKKLKYYSLGTSYSERIEIIGNVLENYELLQ